MYGRIASLISGNLVLQSNDVVLGLDNASLRSSNFSLKFWHLQHGECLALMYTVADIYVDMPDITGHFAMDIDLLEGLKDARYGKLIGDKTVVCHGYRNGRGCRRRFGGRIDLMMCMQKIEQYQNCS
jgi:hypothetical protein